MPLSLFAFDCLHADGEDLIDRPLAERLERLAQIVPRALNVPRLVTSDRGAAQAFLDAALALGHEGIMAKAPGSLYEAGSRGAAWLKIKVAHTLDLVVLAAEWGSGRRQGWLSNLHLGARDPAGGFVMLGKTFKGLTDELLEWQTAKLKSLARSIRRRAITSSKCARSSSSRSRSTSCKRAAVTRAGSRCALRASCVIGPTSGPRTPTRSTPCARSRRRSAALP